MTLGEEILLGPGAYHRFVDRIDTTVFRTDENAGLLTSIGKGLYYRGVILRSVGRRRASRVAVRGASAGEAP
jgi:hypothetical protein